MATAALDGLITGLLLSILVGPVFFLLLETSVNNGMKAALITDAGVIISDVLWISALQLGAAALMSGLMENKYAYLAAAGVFLIIGVSVLLSAKKTALEGSAIKMKSGSHFTKGFLMNAFNPSVVFFWLGVVSLATAKYEGSQPYLLAFFTAVIFTVVATDFLKIYAAHKLKRVLTLEMKKWLSRLTGIIFLGFGAFFLARFLR